MRCTLLFIILLFLVGVSPLASQDYGVSFQSGSVPSDAFALPSSESDSLFAEFLYEGNYYIIIQFDAIPDAGALQVLEQDGVELFAYIPNYAYLAKVPETVNFAELQARALAPYDGSFKLPAQLSGNNFPAYAYNNGELNVVISPWPSVTKASLKAALEDLGYAPLDTLPTELSLTIPEDSLLSIARHPAIQYVDLPEAPPVREGFVGRTSHRLNLLSTGPGLQYDGEGVYILIGDDGGVSHEDFRGRLEDLTNTNFGTHGDMTLGLAGGAGNIDPLGIGAAPGASLKLYDISGYPHISAAPALQASEGFVVTSSSFGEGCGGLYTSTSRDIDKQVYDNGYLLHFFSAGNSASSACSPIYGSLVLNNFRYGNITGGRKVGKNVFAVANLFYDDNRVASSSRGPAIDGRIKPDLSAHGQGNYSTRPDNGYGPGGGTSAASPSLAGTAASLVHAFRSLHNQDPTAALLKGTLLNTADDLGRPGPDFDFGWGRVHAGRALEVIENQQYYETTVSDGSSNTHDIFVPVNVKEVRIMIYWTDAEGSPVAAKALVNDLDLSVATPAGQVRHPWKLSTVPHIDSITKPAYNGVDRLNNMEQVSIVDPASGTYTVKVDGYLVPSQTQDYVVVYTFLYNDVKLVYPQAGDGLVPGEPTTIRWDAYGTNGSFALDYSTNGGNSWNTIASSILGSRRHFNWNVPNIASGTVQVRVRRGGQISGTDGNLSIIGQPNFQVSTIPGNQVRLTWSPVNGANTYRVYRLGSKFMELQGATSGTSFEMAAPSGAEGWYAVEAGIAGSGFGRRTKAEPHTFFACQTDVEITLNFDLRPQETSWQIRDNSGNVIASGGPYIEQGPMSSLTVTECLPYGCFEFVIKDTYSDGMCCGSNGNGSYEVRNENGVLLANGGQFGSQEVTPFCLDPTGGNDLTVQVTGVNAVSCHGGSNGSATVIAAGGSGTYTYAWNNGLSGPTISNLSAGTYIVTVSDGAQSVTQMVAITQPNPLQVTFNTVQPSCSGVADGIISVSVSEGLEVDYAYTWSNGSTGSYVTGLATGFYAVTVTNNKGCTTQASTALTSPSPVTTQIASTPVSCFGNNDGSASIQFIGGGTGNYSVQWSNGSNNLSIHSLSPGNYSVTITDSNGCSVAQNAIVGAAQPLDVGLSATNVPCNNNGEGSITATVTGGAQPYTYSWSNGAQGSVATGLQPGVYMLTVTDMNGCSAVEQSIVQTASSITLTTSAAAASCSGGSASATVDANGGAPPYTYLWSNGATAATVSGLLPGGYTVSVTDANGCLEIASVNVPQTTSITLSFIRNNPDCAGANDGALTLIVNGGQSPYTFEWSNGSTGQSQSGLGAGAYSVTVTDQNGCQTSSTISLTAPVALNAQATSTDATCTGAANGVASVSVTGGTGSYTYAWNNGGTTNIISGLNPNVYQVTVTDQNGCTVVASTEVKKINELEVSLTAQDVSCNGGSDGSVVPTVSGGSGNYGQYLWNTGATTTTLENVSPGGYSLTVVDVLGCQASANIVVQQPSVLNASVSTTGASVSSNGSAVINTNGGTPPYNYAWSNGLSSASSSNLGAGSYQVTVADANGCSINLSFIIENEAPSPCNSRGNSTQYEWIEQVAFGAFVNQSGNDGGLGDFKGDPALLITLESGTTNPFVLTPGYAAFAFNEYWRVWIDFDQDGDYSDPNELLFTSGPSNSSVTGFMELPATIDEGSYTMRVSMKYGSPPQPCANVAYGEVEEYTVNVVEPLIYCSAAATSSVMEWISSVQIGDINNNSGNNGGYGSFLSMQHTAIIGENVDFTLTPGFNGSSIPENWGVYVDFNIDGDFNDPGEEVYTRNNYPFQNGGSFAIPASATPGQTRMRVIMSYAPNLDPCEDYVWGETEDYTLIIATQDPSTGVDPLQAGKNDPVAQSQRYHAASQEMPAVVPPSVYPNPASHMATLEWTQPAEARVQFSLFKADGARLWFHEAELVAGFQQIKVPTADLPNGMYWMVVVDKDNMWRLPLQVAH
ncbi:MAG: GEVED domain-containing protein [Phaeodactylibacter sp.]|uniref:GEVED domain-containing protein n=1 Tax=Phaeodactylibacter sp. TaxID=1940289 RepID=UPI0032EBCA59